MTRKTCATCKHLDMDDSTPVMLPGQMGNRPPDAGVCRFLPPTVHVVAGPQGVAMIVAELNRGPDSPACGQHEEEEPTLQ